MNNLKRMEFPLLSDEDFELIKRGDLTDREKEKIRGVNRVVLRAECNGTHVLGFITNEGKYNFTYLTRKEVIKLMEFSKLDITESYLFVSNWFCVNREKLSFSGNLIDLLIDILKTFDLDL